MGNTKDSIGVEGLIDSNGLAHRLGVSPATVRSWRSRGAAWLPEPVGRLDGLVWRESDLVGIEQAIPIGRGRPSSGKPFIEPGTRQREYDMSLGMTSNERRARGVYYTPKDAAHYIASWVVRGARETYLEPSFGEGAFLRAVEDVATATGTAEIDWIAGELDAETARKAVERGLVTKAQLRIGDFLELEPTPVDAVIANPPYVRLRHLPEAGRTTALKRSAGVFGQSMAPSGSVWMPFVGHMVSFIKLGGRAAIVLPLDFTYVAYARPLWQFLGNHFGSLRVVRTRERIFADINQDVLILFADQKGGTTDSLLFEAFETVSDMVSGSGAVGGTIALSAIVNGERAFQRALLPIRLQELLDGRIAEVTENASHYMKFRIGYVAGDKSYFHPSPATAKRYELVDEHLHATVTNSRRLRGHGLRTSEMGADVPDTLWLPTTELSEGEDRYVKKGVRDGVSKGYKCMQRSPWYVVPGTNAPDVIITVFSERPLLLINDEGWFASNSLLCGYLKSGTPEEFATSWYSPLTLLSIGLQVHSLGGGVMVMVPNEASSIRVPKPNLTASSLEGLLNALNAGDIQAAFACGDDATRELIGEDGLHLVYEGIKRLAHWRVR